METARDSYKVWSAIWLHFFTVAGIILSRTYIDLLFLSTYPKSWLPYYFFGQTIIILILTFGITPLISKGSHVINSSILMTLALIAFVSRILLTFELPGLPFAISLLLSALSVLIGVISWNTVGDAFDVRKFKSLVRWINSAGSFGGLLIGLLIPLIISFFAVEILLYILGLLLILSGLCVFMLRPLPSLSKKPKRGKSPLKYPLFKTLIISVFILMFIDTFADYALKSEVGSAFSKDEIGRFMGPFYGIANALTLAVQLGVANHLLKYFGVALLLSILPGFCIISSAGLLINPGLWMAALFRMGENIFRYSLDNMGCEIAANPLPGQVRRAGKLFLKGIATPLGTGVGAFVLWLIAEQFGLRSVGVATIFASLIWFIIIRKIRSAYQATLKEAIRIKRFSAEREETTELTLQATRNLALHALQEKDPEAVRFGLMILEDHPSEKLPETALQYLDSEFPDIRAAFAKVAGRLKDKKAVPFLMQRLETENDSEVIWRLLEALSIINPEAAVLKASELLKSTTPDIKAGAILVLLAAGDLDALIEAGTALKEMVHSLDTNMRKGAARAISAFKAGKLEKELRLLMGDSDEEVCITAIRAAGARKTLGLTGELIAKLGYGRISRYASRTLVEFGMSGAEGLEDIILREKYPKSRAAIRTLASIPAAEVENIITNIIKSGDVVIKTTMARESALRARRQPVSNVFKQNAHRLVMDEFKIIQILRSAKNTDSISDYVKVEIQAREKLAETRLLYWFAVCTQPSELIDIIPVLMSPNESQAVIARRATAIELLDTIATDKRLKNTITLFEKKNAALTDKALMELKKIDDRWLMHALNTEYGHFEEGKMDITQKVMLLRKTSLFEVLPGEILLTIAEESEDREMVQDEKIFSKGDSPDGLYIVASGTLNVKRGNQIISTLKEGDFFGEIGLLDDSARVADVIAHTDGTLLFIEKEIFDSITEDLPEVLRAVTKTVIGYIKRERGSFRIEPSSRMPIDISVGHDRFQVKNISTSGMGVHRSSEEKRLEVKKEYPFKMTLPLINEVISCTMKLVDISDGAYHCEFIDLGNEEMDKIHLFVLERQKEELTKKRKKV